MSRGAASFAEAEWLTRAEEHRRRLEPVVLPQIERQARGEKHPVYDFLFEYYVFPARKLLHWHPGQGIVLEGPAARAYCADDRYVETPEGVVLPAGHFPVHRMQALSWVIDLLTAIESRPGRPGCLGLHEWAMVYRCPEVRHRQLPLRMSPDELAAFVESQRIVCTHFDAFRFFTPAARPLNTEQPTRPRIHDLEQGACLHANMDLYKWAHKFHPWIGSDLLADCFLLAVDLRILDMQGSAYDCTSLGLAPIAIETVAGRQEFTARQLALAERAAPLRRRLLAEFSALRAVLRKKESGDGIPSPLPHST